MLGHLGVAEAVEECQRHALPLLRAQDLHAACQLARDAGAIEQLQRAGRRIGQRLGRVARIVAIVALLVYEHSLVKPHDLSRVNAAFFTMNGYVSVLFLVFWAADILFHASPIR